MSDFPKKLYKLLPETFAEEVMQMKKDDMKQKVALCEQHMHETEKAKDADEELQKAKEHVKELAASYKETLSIEKAKIKYIFYTLESRGEEF